jgi:Tfp pilus assembly protein PilF
MAQCSRCGEELEAGSRFCGNCGLEVEASGPAPATSLSLSAPGGEQAPRESYLKTGWHLFKQYPGGFIGFTALVLLIQMGLGYLPKVGWMVLFIQYPLMFGFVTVSSRLIQGERPQFGEFFNGFTFLLTLLLLGVVSQIFIILGLLLLVVPGVYLMVGFFLAPWFVLDRGVGFWEAMQLSRRTVQPHWFELFGLFLLIILINLLGVLALGVGLLVTIPVGWCALTAFFATRVGFRSESDPVRGEEPAGQGAAGAPGEDAIPHAAGLAKRRLARQHDWAPVLTLIGFIVVIAASGIYFWKFSPPPTPKEPTGRLTETSGKPAPPMTAQGYLKKGNETRKPQEKILFYSRAIALNPNYAEAYNKRGNAYYDRKEYELALKDYSKAIAIRHDYADAYNDRARLYFHNKDYDKSLKDLDTIIKLQPRHYYSYYNRGKIYYAKNDDDQAIINFDRAIEYKDNYVYSYLSRGNAYFRNKNYKAAINDYTKAITLKPKFSSTYHNRGYAYYLKEDYNKALIDYNKAIDIKPDYADAYYRRAILYKKTGAYDKARADYDKATSLNPRWLDAPFPLPGEKEVRP